MAGQWKLSFRLLLTFEEGNTCNIIIGWKLVLTKSYVSRCASNLLQSEGPAFRVLGMLRSVANGRVSDGQTWALPECIRRPWIGKPPFSFCLSSYGELLKTRSIFFLKKQNPTRVCGAVSFHRCAGEREDETEMEVALQSLALETVKPHGRWPPLWIH